jgi:hypothetical protein
MLNNAALLVCRLLVFFSMLPGVVCAVSIYTPSDNGLTIDSVLVNGVQYNNVVLTLRDFSVVSIGSSSSDIPIKDTCTSGSFNSAIYNSIKIGMTLSQVQQIIGCKPTSTSTYVPDDQSYIVHTWSEKQSGWPYSFVYLRVSFDPTDSIVQQLQVINGVPLFKERTGF